MDRAQELRSLMKGGAKKEEQGPMSGKDKAKLLKMMKEQSKQKEQARPPAQSKPRTTAPPAQAGAQSGLPSDFFDAPAVSAAAPSTISKPSHPSAQSIPARSTSNTISNLPQGFFDNPVEDLNARGISMEQYTAKMEKDEQAELDSFLTQLKGIEGESERLEEVADQRDESVREYEEEAAQMAYLANLIALRAQSEKLSRAKTADSESADQLQQEGSEALDHLLKEVAEVRAATSVTSSAALDVDAILSQKLAQSAAQKRKREAILRNIQNNVSTSTSKTEPTDDADADGSSDSDNSGSGSSDSGSESDSNKNKKAKPVPKYTPLNFMNWTSRTF